MVRSPSGAIAGFLGDTIGPSLVAKNDRKERKRRGDRNSTDRPVSKTESRTMVKGPAIEIRCFQAGYAPLGRLKRRAMARTTAAKATTASPAPATREKRCHGWFDSTNSKSSVSAPDTSRLTRGP